MKFVALNTSIVILAEAHNATILHPAFLSSQQIVPADWRPTAQVICTPAFSVVNYENQIVFTAEPQKLMIRDDAPKPTTPVAELAQKYLEALPHVHYSAVGINFSGYVECSEPEKFVFDRFFKSGPGNDEKLRPNAAGMKLIYLVGHSTLTLGCDVGKVQKSGEQSQTPCLLIFGNYHTSISSDRSLEEALEAVSLLRSRLDHFTEITNIVFGLNN